MSALDAEQPTPDRPAHDRSGEPLAAGDPMADPPHRQDSRDPQDMLGTARRLPDQLADAWANLGGLDLPSGGERPAAVVVAGMGGSAIAADLAAGLLTEKLLAPVVVWRNYGLPGWVTPATLVVVASHSGETEEALAAFAAAQAGGTPCVAITSGGRLRILATEAGVPVVPLPAGGQPRAGLGNALAALLAVLRCAAVIPDPAEEVAAAVALMRSAVAADGPHGPATAWADAVANRCALVCAPEGMAGVARRWKTQLNENAKVMAAWDTLPEMHHNTLVGLRDLSGLGEMLYVVLLAADALPAPLHRRVAYTQTFLRDLGVGHMLLNAPPGPSLAQGLWLVQQGDLLSVRLALRLGVDPTPVPELARLKAILAAGTIGERTR